MGAFGKLKENLFRFRIVPKQGADAQASFTSEKDSVNEQIQEALDAGKRVDLSELLSIISLKGDRNTKYTRFEEMVADGRIGAAVEMYANDTVQYNQEGKVIWVESENSDVSKYCNKLLEDLNIAENIWSYAYCMWLYGDVYLELFQSSSNSGNKPSLLLEPIKQNQSVRSQVTIPGAKLERYVEKIANSAEIYDLQYKGKTSGFVRSQDNVKNTSSKNVYTYTNTSTDIDILNPTKFVHICLSPNINRYPERFKLVKDEPNKIDVNTGLIDGTATEGGSSSLTFQVKSGQSILENVYGAYQTLKLKEDSVLLERITKSSITRIIQVELGDLPENQKRLKLQEIKQQIEQQLILNKSAGTVQSRAGAQPTENIIYTSTRNGKGTISSVNIGGDVDIGNLGDVEDSENKVYGSLLIPKALLGADMEGSGLSNGGSLTEMNTTYARRIKRGQVALCSAIENLINIFALGDGTADKVIGNFTVKLTPIITVEDNRRDDLLQNKIRNVNDILALFNNIDEIDNKAKIDMIIKWMSTYLNQQEIVDIIQESLKNLEQEEKEEEKEEYEDAVDEGLADLEDEESTFTPSGGSGKPSALDFNSKPKAPERKPNLKTDNEIDLNNIEGEDLV